MDKDKMIVRFSKIKNNRLLNRVQMIVDVFHPSEAKVTKDTIREYIRTHFKKQHVSLFGVKKFFGGGRTKGFCLIYDNEESLRKNEPAYRLKRVEVEKLPPKDRKKAGKKEGRKVQKVKKHQGQKKRGTKRRQDKNLARKQNKKKK
jgi:small subunit ribosomal protein S24e